MKKVLAYLSPLYGPRFHFGEEAKGIVKLIECALVGNDVAHISVSTSTQLLAVDMWCQKQGYSLEVFNEEGMPFESIPAAHRYVNDEFIFLDFAGVDNLSIDKN